MGANVYQAMPHSTLPLVVSADQEEQLGQWWRHWARRIVLAVSRSDSEAAIASILNVNRKTVLGCTALKNHKRLSS